jgi:hypothetical protein
MIQVYELEEDIEMVEDITLPSVLLRNKGYAINIAAPNELHPNKVRLSYVNEYNEEIEGMEIDADHFITWLEQYYNDNY